MKPCKPERAVTCGFKVKGDWWATGEHSGIDYGCPTGDPVYAMWGGKVTGGQWGSAYGTHLVIDHDVLPSGDPGLWAIYAHLKSKSVGEGDRVDAGQVIGYSNNTGNSSGPHLHVEVQPQSHWVQGSYRNPQPWIDAAQPTVGPGDVYVSKLVQGQEDSDSVRRLQDTLNGISLSGGSELPITGGYFDLTAHEVMLWQTQKASDKTIINGSLVTVAQAEQLFAGTGNTVIDDVTDDTPPPDEPPSSSKIAYWYSGKPAGELTFSGTYKKLDVPSWAPPEDGLTLGMIYLNVDGEGEYRVRLVREDPADETAYQTIYNKSGDNGLLTHVWFEAGEAGRKLHWEMASMDGTTHTVTTRYAKFATIPWNL